MPSLTIENYVKTIYHISHADGKPAATGQVATALGVSPGTVTSMLKTLSEVGLATYARYEGVQLTASGRTLALRILRRHRLIELFLVNTLGFTWDEVHDEAENLEHAVSDLLIDRLDAYLGFPANDPHGDPIPNSDGTVASHESQSLAKRQVGDRFRLVRVLDQSPEFLRFLGDAGIFVGAEGQVTERHQTVGTLSVTVAGRKTTLGRDAAEKLLVSYPSDGSVQESRAPQRDFGCQA